VELKLAWHDGTLWRPMGEAVRTTQEGTQKSWKPLTVSGTAPTDAVYLRLQLISRNPEGPVWFDDARVIPDSR
jgi:hypothetical protein